MGEVGMIKIQCVKFSRNCSKMDAKRERSKSKPDVLYTHMTLLRKVLSKN